MEKSGIEFCDEIVEFIKFAEKNNVRMLIIGGGAVNFYGYQRSSAAVDFWVELSDNNLEKLKLTLNQMGYEFDEFPEKVKKGLQNVSIKVSPVAELELITKFNPGKSFDEAYKESVNAIIDGAGVRILSYEDLITNKRRTMRPKDMLDIKELERIRKTIKKKRKGFGY